MAEAVDVVLSQIDPGTPRVGKVGARSYRQGEG